MLENLKDEVLEGLKDVVRGWVGPDPDVTSPAAYPIALEYSYDDLHAATGGFRSSLGSGGAGAVYRGLLKSGTAVAVKVLVDAGDASGFEEELQVLSRFRHPNLVTLLGWGQHETHRYLVYELLPGGDVHRCLWKSRHGQVSFPWRHRLRVARDAACGLSHMMYSSPKAFHRDIKTANILLDVYGVAKVADFGLSSMLGGGVHLMVDVISGSPGYSCPLYLQTGCVSEQSEAYSFGIVLLELLTGLSPALAAGDGSAMSYPLLEFVALDQPGAHNRIISGLDASAEWPPQFAAEVADLALSCAASRQELRPTFESMVKVIRHLCSSSGAEIESQAPALLLPRSERPPSSGQETPRIVQQTRAGVQPVADGICRSAPTYRGKDYSIGDVMGTACHSGPSQPPTSLLDRVIGGGTLFNAACCTRINRASSDRISVHRADCVPPCMVAA